MAEAINKGESFTVNRIRKMHDELTGVISYVDINKRVKTW
jgi:hypothetical protein